MRTINSCNLSVLSLFVAFTLLISLIIVGPYGVHAQISNVGNTTTTNTTAQKMGVKITSPKTNQTVLAGPLTIEGTSSDTPNSNCQVYVDWNDAKPMQNVTAIGPGGPNDYSNWTFTYTRNYHLIMAGMNELTSKITCNQESAAVGSLTTKYYSINITGTGNSSSFTLPTKSSNLSSTGTTGLYNVKFNPLLPQYSNSSIKAADDGVAVTNISKTNSGAPTYDNTFDNTNEIKEASTEDSSSASSSSKDDSDDDDNNNSNNGDKSASDDSKDNGSDNHSKDNSDDDKGKSNDDNKVEIHTEKHFKSTKIEKTGHEKGNDKHKLDFKGHHDNPKFGNLHKYIHDLVEKKLKRVSERIFD